MKTQTFQQSDGKKAWIRRIFLLIRLSCKKLRHSLEKYQRTATLKLNETICSGIAGVVKQVAVIQVFQCTAFRGFFGSFNQTNSLLLTPFDVKTKNKPKSRYT